uniref:peptide-methionine (S)-S-oxide reductase n=1 Tax=Physcomitrium patens TaxID=3218 RepID=A0A7I4F9I5_PHYPA
MGETRVASFALGSFWRGEAAFGCLPGVVRTRAGYAGGLKQNPDYHSVGDHAEAVEGPDVGPQYRSVVFTQDDEEAAVAAKSKAAEQNKLPQSEVVTEIQSMGVFYLAEAEHQKFELRRKPQLFQLLGDISDEDLTSSVLATKLNGYAANLCPPNMKKLLDTKVSPFLLTRPNLQQILQF